MRSKAWLAAPVLLAHAEVPNTLYFSMGPKLTNPVVFLLPGVCDVFVLQCFCAATPIPSIILHSVLTAALVNIQFSTLVVLDAMFKNVSLLLEFISFLHLKHVNEGLHRPYKVPGT